MSHREPRRQLTNLRAALLTGGGGVLFEVGGEGGWVRGLGGEDENLDIHLDRGSGLGTATHQAALSRATHEDMLVCASRAKPMPAARTDEVISANVGGVEWLSCAPAGLQLEPFAHGPLLMRRLEADRTRVHFSDVA